MSALGSQEDAYRPSLFELVAQEKLKELLQPAVQYVLAVSFFDLLMDRFHSFQSLGLCSKISSLVITSRK